MTFTAEATRAPFPSPLIPGFNPDPSVVEVDGTFFLVASSFEYLTGIPIYRSRDLITWEHVGDVIITADQLGPEEPAAGSGVWAPTIRYRDGVFVVIVVIVGRGCVVFTATDPTGVWGAGTLIDGVHGIDPDLAWDEQGDAYITFSGFVATDGDPVFTRFIYEGDRDTPLPLGL